MQGKGQQYQRHVKNALDALKTGDSDIARKQVMLAILAEKKRLAARQTQGTPPNAKGLPETVAPNSQTDAGANPTTDVAPAPPKQPERLHRADRIITLMGRDITVSDVRAMVGKAIALYAVLVWLLLVVVDALRQIHDLNSFALHMPVVLVGTGYLGAIHIAWRRNNTAMLIWFLSILWMLGMWT